MSELKKIEDGKVEVTCLVDGEKYAEAKKKAFNKLAKKLEIKGFRKGQVPASLAHKYITDQQAEFEAANDLSNPMFEEAIKEHDIQLIDKASLDIKEIDGNHVTLVYTCPVKPDVKIGDFKSLKYNLEEVKVEDKDIDDEINRTLEQKADLELKEEGTVEKGDTAVIDFDGYKDGVAFDGGKADNYELEIGSGSFIPGFEDQIIGMKAEEEKDINVTFPEDYHVEDLKGAPVVFKVKVHEIKKKVLPTLDDEFIKSLKLDGIETVEAYKNDVKERLTNYRKNFAERKATEDIINAFTGICEVNVPESMIKDEIEQLYQEEASKFNYQGISMDQYQKILGQTAEQIKESMRPTAESRVKTTLCLEALAKQENVEVNDDDINKYYDDLAKGYGMSVDDIKKYVSVENIKSDLKLNKAVDLLKNNK